MDIRPGDVLLFHGTGFVAWAIRAFDGSEVNHAAVAVDADTMAEATGGGLRLAPIADAVRYNRLTVVRDLATAPDMAPVVARARSYVDSGAAYAYQQIAFLAVLSVTRRAPLSPVARRLVRSLLDRGAAALNQMAEQDRRLMICSELVYRCYDEAVAGVPDPYRLEIGVNGARPAAPAPTLLDRAVARLDASDELVLAPLIAAYAAEMGREADLPTGSVAQLVAAPPAVGTVDDELLGSMVAFGAALRGEAGSPPRAALEAIRAVATAPDFVTPGDLLRTRSLADRSRIAGG
jgi:hypothetical protein